MYTVYKVDGLNIITGWSFNLVPSLYGMAVLYMQGLRLFNNYFEKWSTFFDETFRMCSLCLVDEVYRVLDR